MSQDNGPNRSREDRNGTSGSNLLLWAGLIIASGLLVAFWIRPLFIDRLDVGDLKELAAASTHVERGSSELIPGATGEILVKKAVGKETKTYKYSGLDNLVIKDRAIAGEVDIDVIGADGKPIAKEHRSNVNFQTAI